MNTSRRIRLLPYSLRSAPRHEIYPSTLAPSPSPDLFSIFDIFPRAPQATTLNYHDIVDVKKFIRCEGRRWKGVEGFEDEELVMMERVRAERGEEREKEVERLRLMLRVHEGAGIGNGGVLRERCSGKCEAIQIGTEVGEVRGEKRDGEKREGKKYGNVGK